MNDVDSDPSAIDEIRTLKKLFDGAEKFAKEVELFQSDLSIPAINELRYAGHHLLKALAGEDKAAFQEEVLKAKGHCQRSMYEASESGITYSLALIAEFQEDYRDLVVTDIVRDYTSMRVRAKRASEMLSEGRLNRDSPEDQAQKYMESFRGLREDVEVLQESRSDLNARKLALRKEDRRYVTRIVVMAMVPVSIAALKLLSEFL